MNATLPRPTLAARLANVVRADVMRRAHAHAADVFAGCEGRISYAACLRAGLTAAHAGEGRAVAPATVARQAAAWAAYVAGTGARFDVAGKAVASLAFSLDANAAGLLIPTKLVGTKGAQFAAAYLRANLDRPLGLALRMRTETDGLAVYFRADALGRLQPKHERWARALRGLRVAALAVTGGTEDRPTLGVNVALEVWPFLPAPDGGEGAALDAHLDAAAAEMEAEADARHLYGEPPAYGPGTLGAALTSTDPRTAADAWGALGGWEQ